MSERPDQISEPWTHKRIRHRLTTLIEVMPAIVAHDIASRKLIENIAEDLREIRARLDQLAGDYK
jgi:hypothetical protein